MRNVFLKSKRIYLRPLELSDLNGNYVSWLNDEQINEHNSHHVFPYSLKEGYHYIEKAHLSKDALVLAIVTKRKNKHIGNISLQNIDYLNRNAELAILLGEKEYLSKGYSKEASLLLLSHAFNALGLLRIYCGTSVKNKSMQKLAKKLGMILEGRRRKAMFKNGNLEDILEYGILADEFEDK